jgi:radical SAM-linked protein
VLEGVFARGDRRLAPVIERAVSLGASFDAWSEGFNPGIWKKAFEIEGLNPSEFASRGRGLDEPLPWRHLKIGVDSAWLASEREKALDGELTLGCENAPCADPCGACDREVESIRYDQSRLDQPCESVDEPRDNYARLRLIYSKTGAARYIGHLDTVREFHRSLRRAGIRIQYTEGFHPKARLGFGEALPVGVGSLVEMVDVWVHKSQDTAELPDRLNGALPEGFRVTDAREIAPNAPSIESATRSMRYRFDLGDKGRDYEMELKERESRYEAAPDWPIEKTTKSGVKRVDLKKAVARIAVLPHGVVEMDFSGGGAEGRVKPRAAFESVFGALPEDAQITKVAAGME